MAKSTGILLDPTTGDLLVSTERDANGRIVHGLVIGEATGQNQALILRAFKGEYKEYPTLGAGLSGMLGDDSRAGWKREIALQLEADDMKISEVGLDFTNNKLTIDADYDS